METIQAFIFQDPRINFSHVGKMVVKIATTATLLIFLVLTAVLVLSDVAQLRYLGFFLVLFWIDYVAHIGRGRIRLDSVTAENTINVAHYMKPKVIDVLETAVTKQRISKEHFGLAAVETLTQKTSMQKILNRLDVEPREFQGKLHSLMTEFGTSGEADESWDEFLSSEFLERLMEFAQSRGAAYIEEGDVLAALLTANDHRLERLRQSFAINGGGLRAALMMSSMQVVRPTLFSKPTKTSEVNPVNKAWTSRPTPELDKLGDDLTTQGLHGKGRVLFGHENEYRLLVEGLAKTKSPNVLLVGSAGSGKSAMIEHLAYEMAAGGAPAPLNDMRLATLDISRLTAGADPGAIQERLEKVVEEILTAGNIALYIPDVQILFKTSGEGHVSAAETLLPVLNDDNFPVVATVTPEDFARSVEPNGAFARVFEKVSVEEISAEAAERFLVGEALQLEGRTGITVAVTALRSSVSMAKAHLRPKTLPGSAVELLGHAFDIAKRSGGKNVGSDEVYKAVEEITKVPVKAPGKEEEQELLHLEDIIHERFIDQEEAVKAVADALREYRSGLTREGGPIASFMFVGPTGVGKTQLAKLLAEEQFGSEEAMIRFDMSEYQDKQSVFQFIGSPDGKLPGALTEAVRSKPHAILLFDEFEKAFSDIHNLFLQILDDARLTDTLGRTVDFKETIIIATSNAHSEKIAEALRGGKTIPEISADFKNTLTDVFKPELINRFSKIIVFKSLEEKELIQITKIRLSEFEKTLEEKNLKLDFAPELVGAIARWGYDPAFGARPLDRVIEEKLRAPLAQYLLQNHPPAGTTIQAKLEGEGVSFSS